MFDSRYEVCLADTAESQFFHYRVRYQVFCIEHGFESPEARPGLQECDEWDSRARHFVVHEKQSAAAVAAVRIVLPAAGGALPVERLGCITERLPFDVSREQLAEVSRIGVIRRLGDPAQRPGRPRGPGSVLRSVGRDDESGVLLGLIRTVILYSADSNIGHLYMLVTRPFARLLKRLGIVCTKIGDEIEHRGLRAPYVIDVNASWHRLVARSGAVADLFSRRHLAYLPHSDLRRLRVGGARTVDSQGLALAAA